MAKTDWEAEALGINPTPTSRWRLVTGVIFVIAATLGLGFYLPLQRGQQLLTSEYQKAHQAAAELKHKLDETESSLAKVSAERGDLLQAKQAVDSKDGARKEALDRVVAALSQRFQQALDRQKLRAAQLPDRVHVELADRAAFTVAGDALTFTGQKLICQLETEARKQGNYRWVVRATVANAAPVNGDSRWSLPTRQATAVADALITRCGVTADKVEIAAALSPAAGADALEARPPMLELFPL